ncbi:MAG: MotA/TolQ/ExbB proton channel family protein [Candidatus Gastranaerophilales bacterium]|nr:MotA/TolQ/ExbB proton channel family protein [Candidatus Gastranaerophilales bacterium]
MKNKLFCLLLPVYLCVVWFVLQINGVFTGQITSASNLLINLGFLLLIGILFAISFGSFFRLNRMTDKLIAEADKIYRAYDKGDHRLWETYCGKDKVFEHEVLDEAFGRYRKKMNSFQTKHGLMGRCEIEDYLNEDLLNQTGMNYYNSAISGTMTGLGILGTFIGLSIGLGSFDGNDIYTISDNVGPLLDGMKVAFHTSVYGILFSLVFQFAYRSLMSDAYDKLQEFLAAFRECVEPMVNNTDDNAKAMLLYQANMANSMKQMTELLKGEAREQAESLDRMAQNFALKMEQALGADFDKLGQILQKACSAQETYADNYHSMEETAKELLQANRTLQKALEETLDRQEAMERKLKEQAERINATCDSINEEISNQLYTYAEIRGM